MINFANILITEKRISIDLCGFVLQCINVLYKMLSFYKRKGKSNRINNILYIKYENKLIEINKQLFFLEFKICSYKSLLLYIIIIMFTYY